VTRLAVLGSPIGHSKSPALHAAAYRALGLDWQYTAVEVAAADLAGFVRSRDASWRGLSLTMPLKRDVLPLLDSVDDTARLTGGANTLLFDRSVGDAVLRGFNTDVYGVTRAFRDHGVAALDTVLVLGGGATAASAIVSVRQLGARSVTVAVRDPARAGALETLGASIGCTVTVRPLDGIETLAAPDAVVSTIPGHAGHGLEFPAVFRSRSVLFDVAYDPWPSRLAAAWLEADGRVISGLDMLLHQAVAQVRVFVSGNPVAALPDEAGVLAAMRASVAVGG
jgi:shikimate dehydrogenase